MCIFNNFAWVILFQIVHKLQYKKVLKLSWKEANYLQEFITEPREHLTTTTKNSRGANRQNVTDKHTGPAGCVHFRDKWFDWRVISQYARGITEILKRKCALDLRQGCSTPYRTRHGEPVKIRMCSSTLIKGEKDTLMQWGVNSATYWVSDSHFAALDSKL